MAKSRNTDSDFNRIAIVIRETGEVSSIHRMDGTLPFLDKNQEQYKEMVQGVPDYVRIGMRRQADGLFDFPEGHTSRQVRPTAVGAEVA